MCCEDNGLIWRWCLGNMEDNSKDRNKDNERNLWQLRYSHLTKHPQANPFAWQSSPLRSGCRTHSQPGLTCACKVQQLINMRLQPTLTGWMWMPSFPYSRWPVRKHFLSTRPFLPSALYPWSCSRPFSWPMHKRIQEMERAPSPRQGQLWPPTPMLHLKKNKAASYQPPTAVKSLHSWMHIL